MTIKIYQVDAFTDKIFSGNPAAVCPLDEWLPDALMQDIAMENNLAETAFYVAHGDEFHIRWFTPATEVDLCGHATLAAAFVLFNHEDYIGDTLRFYSHRSGYLPVTKDDNFLTLNFPADTFDPITLSKEISDCFDRKTVLAFKGKTDLMLVFDTESDIIDIRPDFENISDLDYRGVIVTAKGDDADFVSRFFAPRVGIKEDPVTGSAHTTLIPYWTERLNKTELTAKQLSDRGGYLRCRYLDNRVEISGQGKLYMKGEVYLD